MYERINKEKCKIHHHKDLILLEDINSILISSMISSGEKIYKYFIGYKDDDDDYKIKPLHIMLPKTSAYVKHYDGETK